MIRVEAGQPRKRVSIPDKEKSFILSQTIRPTLQSTQPPTKRLPRTLYIIQRVSFLGLKRLVREAYHSPPSTAEVRNEGRCTSPNFLFLKLGS